MQNYPYQLLSELKIESFVHSTEPVIFTSKATPFCQSSLCNNFKYSKDISLIMPEKVMSKKELSSHYFSNPFLLRLSAKLTAGKICPPVPPVAIIISFFKSFIFKSIFCKI